MQDNERIVSVGAAYNHARAKKAVENNKSGRVKITVGLIKSIKRCRERWNTDRGFEIAAGLSSGMLHNILHVNKGTAAANYAKLRGLIPDEDWVEDDTLVDRGPRKKRPGKSTSDRQKLGDRSPVIAVAALRYWFNYGSGKDLTLEEAYQRLYHNPEVPPVNPIEVALTTGIRNLDPRDMALLINEFTGTTAWRCVTLKDPGGHVPGLYALQQQGGTVPVPGYLLDAVFHLLSMERRYLRLYHIDFYVGVRMGSTSLLLRERDKAAPSRRTRGLLQRYQNVFPPPVAAEVEEAKPSNGQEEESKPDFQVGQLWCKELVEVTAVTKTGIVVERTNGSEELINKTSMANNWQPVTNKQQRRTT